MGPTWGAPASLSLIPEKIGVVELPVNWSNQAGHVMYSRVAQPEKAEEGAAAYVANGLVASEK